MNIPHLMDYPLRGAILRSIHVEVPELKDRRRFKDPRQKNDWI